jgi:plastocyanin
MKKLAIGIVLVLTVVVFNSVYAQGNIFEMKGSGAAITTVETPKLYTSTMRIIHTDTSVIDRGIVIVHGNDLSIVARFVADKWTFSYQKDGSFHGEGLAQTAGHDEYNVSLDGTRIFATKDGSMWKVSAVMEGKDRKLVLDYLLLGKDPAPTVSVSGTEHVLIPNGNSAQVNTGFFIPLNLEATRGTTVIWQNDDNIGHTVQSQDAHGNVIPMFNSGVLKTGDTFSYKFEKPGVYHYFCTIHPWRIGVITVP